MREVKTNKVEQKMEEEEVKKEKFICYLRSSSKEQDVPFLSTKIRNTNEIIFNYKNSLMKIFN